jgi:patatin-like phospholipase/acyl hydrolase
MADARKAILAIDGGGIRGLIPALVLQHIEDEIIKRPIADAFDVIAGTSTGGIIALGLTCVGETKRPRYRAHELADIYVNDGQEIFPHEAIAKARRFVEPKYPSTGREAVLDDKLGASRLADAATDVIITAYDIEKREAIFFRSARADKPTYDFAMRDIALATSAAPTYFAPQQIRSRTGETFTLVDGGVFANNPAMCALVDGESDLHAKTEGVMMLSLGTGSLVRPFPYADARSWGLIDWGFHVLDVVLDGVSDTVHHQVGMTLPEDDYLRLQTDLKIASDDMDDAQSQNIASLAAEAHKLIDDRHDDLVSFCDRLPTS